MSKKIILSALMQNLEMSFRVRYRRFQRHRGQPCWRCWPLRCPSQTRKLTILRAFTLLSISLVLEMILGGWRLLDTGRLLEGASNTNATLQGRRLLDTKRLFECGRLFDHLRYDILGDPVGVGRTDILIGPNIGKRNSVISRKYNIQYNPDFLNLQGKRNLLRKIRGGGGGGGSRDLSKGNKNLFEKSGFY